MVTLTAGEADGAAEGAVVGAADGAGAAEVEGVPEFDGLGLGAGVEVAAWANGAFRPSSSAYIGTAMTQNDNAVITAIIFMTVYYYYQINI